MVSIGFPLVFYCFLAFIGFLLFFGFLLVFYCFLVFIAFLLVFVGFLLVLFGFYWFSLVFYLVFIGFPLVCIGFPLACIGFLLVFIGCLLVFDWFSIGVYWCELVFYCLCIGFQLVFSGFSYPTEILLVLLQFYRLYEATVVEYVYICLLIVLKKRWLLYQYLALTSCFLQSAKSMVCLLWPTFARMLRRRVEFCSSRRADLAHELPTVALAPVLASSSMCLCRWRESTPSTQAETCRCQHLI